MCSYLLGDSQQSHLRLMSFAQKLCSHFKKLGHTSDQHLEWMEEKWFVPIIANKAWNQFSKCYPPRVGSGGLSKNNQCSPHSMWLFKSWVTWYERNARNKHIQTTANQVTSNKSINSSTRDWLTTCACQNTMWKINMKNDQTWNVLMDWMYSQHVKLIQSAEYSILRAINALVH